MYYLIQYITEIQIQYKTAFSKPIKVLEHLLFTIGGVDFVDGNPVEYVKFYRYIPFTDYYNNTKIIEECLEYYENVLKEKEIEQNYNFGKFLGDFKKLTEKEQWEAACKKEDKAIASLKFLTPENIFDYNYWYQNLVTDLKTFPLISIYKDYSCVFKINKNTETALLRVSKLIVQVYIDFYNRCLSDSEYFNNILESISSRRKRSVQLENIKTSLNDLYFVKQTLDLIN